MKTKIFSLMLIFTAFVCVTSCSKDDDAKPTLNETNLTLYVDETATLKYSGGNCEWSSENPLVAEVKNGVVTAKHVGTTIIYANESACSVTVKPRYNSFVEPYMNWDANKSMVKSYMSGYTLSNEADNILLYTGKNKVASYIYMFENEKLYISAFTVSLYDASTLSDFLLERYLVLSIDDSKKNDYYIYMSSVDMKTAIVYNLTTSGVIVMYTPVKDMKSVNNVDLKSELKAIQQTISNE